MLKILKQNKLLIIMLLMVCLSLSGCATLGAVAGGFFSTFRTLIKIPLELLKVLADILNKLPRPPPGVIPGF